MRFQNISLGLSAKRDWSTLLDVTSGYWENSVDGFIEKIQAQIRRRQAKRHNQLKRRGKISHGPTRHKTLLEENGGRHEECS